MIATAETYLQGGLVAHDAALVSLAPDCIRSENGWDTGGTTVMSDYFPHMTMCQGIRNLRWVVEGNEAVARFHLVVTGGFEVTITEYFQVGPAGITRIAPTFAHERWMDNAIGPADGRLRRVRRPKARHGQPAETVALAERTFSALAAGEPDDAPLGADVTVTDNGAVVARGIDAAREALATGVWSGVSGDRLQQWVVEGDEAVGRFELDRPDGGLVVGALSVRVFGDRVREVETTWGAGPSAALLAEFRASHPD